MRITTKGRRALPSYIVYSVVLILSLGTCELKAKTSIPHIAFSPENDKLIVTICDLGGRCTLATLNISTGAISLFRNPNAGTSWKDPQYSSDGRQIVFIEVDSAAIQSHVMVMNADGTGLRQITNGPNFRVGPSFSTDSKRIIYLRTSERQVTKRKTVIEWDVYGFDIGRGSERRLTIERFDSASHPFYFPDGQRFIFSGDGFRGSCETLQECMKYRSAYEEKFKHNNIYVMDGKPQELKPYIQIGWRSSFPVIAMDGSQIIFTSITNEMDGIRGKFNHDIFIKSGDVVTRLTRLRSLIGPKAISFDGSRIAFYSDPERDGTFLLWVMNSDGSGLARAKVPREFPNID